jgi:hypothetical protein
MKQPRDETPKLRKVTVYLTAEELLALKAEAESKEKTLSSLIRAKIKLPQITRGAPLGNANRRKPPLPKSKRKLK